MPKVTLTFTETNPMPESLKAFKTSDTTAEVWVGATQDAIAAELNPTLAANRDTILGEKNTFEAKYKALVETSTKDDVEMGKKIAALELQAKTPIPEGDKKLLDAIKAVKADATPEFVSEAIKEYPVVTEKLTTIETTRNNDALFTASGYKNRTVFDTVFNNPALNPNFDSVVWKDEKDTTGNPVKTPYIKVKTAIDGKVELPFDAYTKATPEWAGFMPSLTNSQQPTQQWNPAQQSQQYQHFQAGATTQQGGVPSNNFLDAVQQGQAKMNAPKEPAANADTATK